jgi:hypothetical protein
MVLYSGLSVPHPTLSAELLSLLSQPPSSLKPSALTPSTELWGAVTETSFTPVLTASLMDRIDLLVNSDPIMSSTISQQRAELSLSAAELRAQHTAPKATKAGPRDGAPRPESMRKNRLCDNCARSCKEAGVDAMRACSRCRMAFYCSAECQKQKWKLHKPLCMPLQKK